MRRREAILASVPQICQIFHTFSKLLTMGPLCWKKPKKEKLHILPERCLLVSCLKVTRQKVFRTHTNVSFLLLLLLSNMLQVSQQGFTGTQYINYTSHLTMQILCVCFTHNNNNENSLRRLIRYLYCSAGRTLETVGQKVSATLEMIWGKVSKILDAIEQGVQNFGYFKTKF